MSPTAITPAHKNEFTVLMALLMSIVAISIDALLPALGVIGSDLRVTNINHTQLLISVIFLGMGLGELLAGPLSDAIGRRKVLFAGIGIYLVGSVVCYFAASFEILMVGRLIQGIGVAGPYISSVTVVRDKYSGRQMAQLMSVIMMIFIMVPAIAPALGQGILYLADWRGIFLLYIGYALAVGVWILFRLEETLPVEKRTPLTRKSFAHGFREVVGNRATASYMVCMGICFGSFMGYLNSSRQIFQDMFGAGDMFALYFGLLALVLGSASLLNSRFVVKLGMHYIGTRAFAAVAISSALFLTVHLIVDIQLWMFLAYAAVLFFSFGLVFGNLNALAMEPMGHIAGMATAIIGAVSSVISMGLGSMIGQMFNGTLIPMTWGFLSLSLVCLALMAYANGKRQHVEYHPEEQTP